MARSRGGRVTRGARRRQRVEWGVSLNTDYVTVPANSASVQTSSASLNTLIDTMTSPTVVRVRGEILIKAQGTAADEVLVAAGIAIVSQRASSAGVIAVPRPASEADFSWLWHKFAFLEVLSGTNNLASVIGAVRVEIDSRAMRKVLSTEEELVLVVETRNIAGAASIKFAANIRVLVKQS